MTGAKTARLVLGLCVALLLTPPPAPAQAQPQTDPKMQAYEQLAARIQQDPAGATEDQVMQVIKQSQELAQPFAAAQAVKAYLGRNTRPSPGLLDAAAQNAVLSGDYRSAVARYKKYMEAAKPSPESSEVAARLYTVLLQMLNTADDAYQVNKQFGDTFRQSLTARKFDSWFLAEAIRRNDVAAVADRLAVVLAEKLPLEQETLYFGEALEWLMNSVSQAQPAHFPALQSLRKIVPLVRSSKQRSLLYSLYLANLEFASNAAGKDEATLEKNYGQVLAAARACFDAAPGVNTALDICTVFFGGQGRQHPNHYRIRAEQKQQFLIELLDRLSDGDRKALVNASLPSVGAIYPHLFTPEQWIQVGFKYPQMLQDTAAGESLPFLQRAERMDQYTAQAAFLQGVPSRAAAVINASAAGAGDFNAAVAHLMQKEAWHLGFNEPWEVMNQVWQNYNALPDDQLKNLPLPAVAQLTFGREHVFSTPVALFDLNAAKGAMLAAFQASGKDANDKSQVPALLHALDWVPYSKQQRSEVFSPAYEEFKRWTQGLRQARQRDAASVSDEVLAQVTPIEEAFKQVMDPAVSDVTKAPNTVCKLLAQAVVAVQQKNLEAYTAAARELYALARDYQGNKLPFGGAIVRFIAFNRLDAFDTLELQCEILADQLANWRPDRRPTAITAVIDTIMARPSWTWFRIPAADKDKAIALNNVFAKALKDQLAKNQFWPGLFYYFRGTRVGAGWQEQDHNTDVLATMIQKKTLASLPAGDRVTHRFAATSYQWLIRAEFQPLQAQFPVERYFDDMFVEEATQTRQLDSAYWSYGRDENKKIVNVAAQVLQTYDSLPFGADGQSPVWSRSEFWSWQGRALGADAAQRDALLAKLEASYGKTRFDPYAMGRGYFATVASTRDAASRADFFQKLNVYLDRASKEADLVGPPFMGALTDVSPDSLTDAEVDTLLKAFTVAVPEPWAGGWHHETMASLLVQGLIQRNRASDIYRLIPHLWALAKDANNANFQRQLGQLAKDLVEKDRSGLATVLSVAGLDLIPGTEMPDDVRQQLTTMRAKAMTEIGASIPVPPSDPRYPLYAAQAAYLTDRLDSAWDQYSSRRELLGSMMKELDPQFLIWIIEQSTSLRRYDEAESIARQFIQLVETNANAFEPEVRASLVLAYADIAMAREEYPRARAQYERIAAAPDYANTRARSLAELSVAEVDRVTRQFDKAQELLDKLVRRPEKWVQAQAHFQRAQLYYDQESWDLAKEELESVFIIDTSHQEARLLQGKLALQLKKFEVAAEIEIGTSENKRLLIPGKPLKVSLRDPNLAVARGATTIEVRVWTKSGDEEKFNLFPHGDDKTRFQGEIDTRLGAAAKGDHILQVLGNDVIEYNFSEAVRVNADGAEIAAPPSLTVASDAELFASSGRILTTEEIEEQRMEAIIRQKLELDQDFVVQQTLSARRPADQIKPGNRINVRVIDFDRNVSDKRDSLPVRLTARSGDELVYSLVETEEHSGIFEGAVPTAGGQATAYASDSDEASQPNFAISTQNYPAWVGRPDNVRPKLFSIDLNDNVAPTVMTLLAGEPGRKIKNFLVQTSINGRDYTTIGSYPDEYKSWDGSLSLEAVRVVGTTPTTVPAFQNYLEQTYVTRGLRKVSGKVSGMSFRWDANVAGMAGPMQLQNNDWYIVHIYGAFYLPRNQVRTFQIDHKGRTENIRYIMAIDGKVDPRSPHEIRQQLAKGVHRLDIYVAAFRHANPTFEVLCDTPEPPFMVPCPPEMFDPAKHPQIRDEVLIDAAQVKALNEGAKFEIEFSPRTRARVIRLVLNDFETDAPAIKKITLVDNQGRQILPTAQDFNKLKENETLEIVPGDRIAISYEDPVVVTSSRKNHETFLTATYSNAELSACFVEYEMDSRNERRARYFPMRRFTVGDRINVFINDPDRDITDEQDRISFTAKSYTGQPVTIEAMETEAHSGVFVGTVFPVAGEPTRNVEVQVKEGDDIVLRYEDKDNTDPGVPWVRTYNVEQAWSQEPELRVYEVTSRPLSAEEIAAAEQRLRAEGRQLLEHVPVRRAMVAVRPEQPTAVDKAVPALIDGPLLVELMYPTIAQSPMSEATVYVQTSTGRKMANSNLPPDQFDINVPGTIRMEVTPSEITSFPAPQGYREAIIRGNPYASDPLDDGRFTFSIPVEMGPVPNQTLAFEDWERTRMRTPLSVKGDDILYVGFKFKDPQGNERWTTRQIELKSDVFLDVMDRKYQQPIDTLHVGENVYYRVIHKSLDTTDDKDMVNLDVVTASGHKSTIQLMETFGHSGIFKGVVGTIYRGEPDAAADSSRLLLAYGDQITSTYKPYDGAEALTSLVNVYKGADGEVIPFTKRFKDPKIAVDTQFTVAEAYFELAKRHRDLGEEDVARREIAQGKKLLEEAIRDYPDNEARAQADYLLANLSFEFAKDTVNQDMQHKLYMEAITRFSDIVSSYPDSLYAPKSQYKKALVLEKMGQIDQACEEYVKLSYRYPENELVAETIARLGQYFLTKGKDFEQEANKQQDAVEREKIKLQGFDMFRTAGEVFGRLSERFPNHNLAGKTLVLSAQCYMRAEEFEKAIKGFQLVYTDTKAENELAAESMYWAADCYMKQKDFENAYRTFKKLTWDYPESKWAKFARGRLTDEALIRVSERDAET